jgi:hypothetical protein
MYSENVDQPRPTGKVRFYPVSGSDLDLQNDIGSPLQQWYNDLDAHTGTVMLDMADGELAVEAGALVYGVFYQATVFAVDGHSYDNFYFQAGEDGDQTITLYELNNSDLQLVSRNDENGQPVKNGQLVLTFNREVEFSPEFTTGYYAELLDDNFDIDSQDTNGDANENVLVFSTDEPTDQERGTSIKISGNTVTLTWANVAANFDSQDAEDTILSAIWGGLNGIQIRVVGEENQTRSLGFFLGSSHSVLINSEPVTP